MDYEKSYNQALERAKKIHNQTEFDYEKGMMEEIFPELKESEDEKVRKWLLDTITQIPNDSIEWDVIEKAKVLSWLEKQGEQKAIDKVEPKFKVGDWVANDYCAGKVIELTDDAYLLDTEQGIPFSYEHNAHLWTIDDAKDGDVLVDVYGNIGIFQKNDDFDWSSYCSLGSNGGFRCFAIEHELDRSHPATKEQRDTLERAMTNAGYRWNKEELKLEKI